MVSEKTGCSSGFRVNQYKSLCAFSLSLNSLNLVFIFVNWYKQPIVSTKQSIVFLRNNRLFFCETTNYFSSVVLFALCFDKLIS